MTDFRKEVAMRIDAVATDTELNNAAKEFLLASFAKKYSYNFLGKIVRSFSIPKIWWLCRKLFGACSQI